MNKTEPSIMAPEIIHDTVFELVQKHLTEPCDIIELGAGQGAFAMRLKKLGHRVLAVDGDGQNWRAPEIDLKVINLDSEFAETIGEGKKYDAITAIEIIEHLENPFSFVRQCAELLKPNGFLFVTTPNPEAINSRIMFLYTGRFNYFNEPATIRTAHITPVFNWKLDMILDESNFENVYETFTNHSFGLGKLLKGKLSAIPAFFLYPFVKGKKYGEGRIVVAQLK